MNGGHYVINRQSHTFHAISYGIIVLVTAKIALAFISCNFVYYSYNYSSNVYDYLYNSLWWK